MLQEVTGVKTLCKNVCVVSIL